MNRNPIDEMMKRGLRENIYPGAVLLVGKNNRILLHKAYGKANLFSGQLMTRETIFDLASLTKPLATTLAIARMVDQQRIALDLPVVQWLPSLDGSDKERITVQQLLCHNSGLPAHRPFYMLLKTLSPKIRKKAVLNMLRSVPLYCPAGESTRYSDLGFMLLCRLIETVAGGPMDLFLKKEVYDPMGLYDLFFVDLLNCEQPKFPFAATELCPLRNRLLVGEVHDDNAWFAGGIDGHAGLFGTGEAIFRLLRKLVDNLNGSTRRPSGIFSRQILTEIIQGGEREGWPLGFDRPSAQGSSAGQYFSTETVGHLGFTGVSFWLDLRRDFTIILLTNRVHPSRWNNGLVHFRPKIHDQIMEHFEIV